MVDIHSQYGQQISRAILIRCKEKESMGISNLYDSDIYDIVEILKQRGIKSSYKDVERVLDNLLKGKIK